MRCLNLSEDNRCQLFGKPERPAFCLSLRPNEDMCGSSRAEALQLLEHLEQATTPNSNKYKV